MRKGTAVCLARSEMCVAAEDEVKLGKVKTNNNMDQREKEKRQEWNKIPVSKSSGKEKVVQ